MSHPLGGSLINSLDGIRGDDTRSEWSKVYKCSCYLSYRELSATPRLIQCPHGVNMVGTGLATDSFVFLGILLIYMIMIDISIQNRRNQFYSALETIREGTYCPLIAHVGWYPLKDVSLLHFDLVEISMHQNACKWFKPLANLMCWKHMMHTWLEEKSRMCNVTHQTITCYSFMSSNYRSYHYPKETGNLDRSASLEISISLFSLVRECMLKDSLFLIANHKIIKS